MSNVRTFLAEIAAVVEQELDRLVPTADVSPVMLHKAVRWSLFAGGKRFRPALLIAVGRTFGAADASLLRSAAAIEMIHTYSLIHDDLPSMDDDELRRGRATCHVQFGEAAAILAGDVLQTLAFAAVAGDTGLSPETRLEVISIFARAAGTPDGMVSGQQLDLEAEGRDASIEQITAIHRQKTGALIIAAADAGAAIANAALADRAAVRRYAGNLGLLFQITDDLLDVTQGTQTLGKTAGKDARVSKATYPQFYGVEEANSMARDVRDDALTALAPLHADTVLLAGLAEFVFSRSS